MRLSVSILFLIFSLFSCEKETKNNLIAENNVTSTKDCKCFDGIGSSKNDDPVLTYQFDNNKSVNVCGFVDKEMSQEYPIVSEFDVFDCETGKSYVRFGALEICRLKQNKNELVIQQLRYLPIGTNWNWELIQISEQTITPKGNQLKVSDLKPKVDAYTINATQAEEFLNSLENEKSFETNWEENIGKLEALSIIGNKKAWDKLINLETITGLKFDGALSEAWKSAIENVKWIKKYK